MQGAGDLFVEGEEEGFDRRGQGTVVDPAEGVVHRDVGESLGELLESRLGIHGGEIVREDAGAGLALGVAQPAGHLLFGDMAAEQVLADAFGVFLDDGERVAIPMNVRDDAGEVSPEDIAGTAKDGDFLERGRCEAHVVGGLPHHGGDALPCLMGTGGGVSCPNINLPSPPDPWPPPVQQRR